MLSLTMVIGILPFLFIRLSFQFVLVLLVITLIGVLVVWKKPLSKKLLYINNILLLCAPLCISYVLSISFIHDMDTFIGMVAAVVIMDVFSFMKLGKNTLNAKLSGNINSLARLSICLPVPKKSGLQPIIGVGDLNYYSFIVIFSLKTGGPSTGLSAFFILLMGQIVNLICIAIMKKRQWKKGFPATLFPGIFIVIAMISHII